MSITMVPISETERRPGIIAYLEALPGPTDSYHEDNLHASRHYRLLVNREPAGQAAINNESLITMFSVEPDWRHMGQELFTRVRHTENAQAALVPSSDEIFLIHAMDNHRRLTPQAHAFSFAPGRVCQTPHPVDIVLANPGDAAVIEAHSGDFFAPLTDTIATGKLFLATRDGTLVGFGIIDRSRYRPVTASIGMFVLESVRGQGLGASIIGRLIAECDRHGITPVAGCWYYNHASKRTLERAGMYAAGRLFRFEF